MDIRPIASSAQAAPGALAEKQPTPLVNEAPSRPAIQAAEPGSTVQQPASVPNIGQVTQAVQNINKMLQQAFQTQNVEFTIDSETERPIVKVVDQRTKEVLRQIPSEEVLELAKALDLSQGMLISQKA